MLRDIEPTNAAYARSSREQRVSKLVHGVAQRGANPSAANPDFTHAADSTGARECQSSLPPWGRGQQVGTAARLFKTPCRSSSENAGARGAEVESPNCSCKAHPAKVLAG